MSNLASEGLYEVHADPTITDFNNGLYDHLRTPHTSRDFGWALTRLAGVPQYQGVFLDLKHFYERWEQVGPVVAASETGEDFGIPVGVVHAAEREEDDVTTNGRLLGVLGEGDFRGQFWGIAMAESVDGTAVQLAEVLVDVNTPGFVLHAGVLEA